jgi:hypothetical protein
MSDMNDLFGGGPNMGMPSFPDMLPTHPKAQRQKGMKEEFDFKVRVAQYDLNEDSERAEYEQVLTDVIYGKKLLRQEKWSSDNNGRTTIAVSWVDLIPKRRRSGTAMGKSVSPGPVHGSNPGLEDGEYPGNGAIVEDDGTVILPNEKKGEAPEGTSPSSEEEVD